jgi:cyclic pyranopterin phosphate synthase
VIIQQLLEHGFVPELRKPDSGPAQEFTHPDYAGKIGIIAPYSKDFCKSCNRLRVTSRGKLMLCLFGEGGYDLRPYLQADDQREELIDAISRRCISNMKPIIYSKESPAPHRTLPHSEDR